jgi:hypothetical protein
MNCQILSSDRVSVCEDTVLKEPAASADGVLFPASGDARPLRAASVAAIPENMKNAHIKEKRNLRDEKAEDPFEPSLICTP